MSELIDVLLAESELPDDPLLRQLLGELEREATSVAPMPSAALSELMNPRRATPSHARTRGARRRPSLVGRTAVITGVVVIGALGLGAGAAAASPDARSAIGAGVAVIAHLFEPPTANGRDSLRGPAGDATESPDPTGSPDATHSPGPTRSPDATHSPEPTHSTDATDSPEATESPEPSPSVTPSPSDDGSDGHGKSGDTHGNGKGNQSGHGNGKGQGNGGPAPTP